MAAGSGFRKGRKEQRNGAARSKKSNSRAQSNPNLTPLFSAQNGGKRPHKTQEPESEENVSEDDLSDGSSDDDETKAPVRSYGALLQSFQQTLQPRSRPIKRRKVDVEGDEGIVNGSVSHNAEDSKFASDAESDDVDAVDADPRDNDDVEDEDEDEADGVHAGPEVVLSNGNTDADAQDDKDDEDDADDPYEAHFAPFANDQVTDLIKAANASKWRTEQQTLPNGFKYETSVLPTSSSSSMKPLRPVKTLADVHLKQRLRSPVEAPSILLDEAAQSLAGPLFGYHDVLFAARTVQNCSTLRTMASLHALNHVFKGRDHVLKNNQRLTKDPDLELRDQGFTRPKVLILLETRKACYSYIETLVRLADPEQQEHKKRFEDAFSGPLDKHNADMPEDFQELFQGNDDNDFRLGIKFTRKTIKFFSQFYASDIILASPLGLRRIIEHEDAKKADSDFLSSIEIVVVDQADAMLMQNWEHVDFVLSHLNLQPKDAHGCDFSRVRNAYLDGQAKHLRQTIVFSAFLTPELNRVYNTSMANLSGKHKISPTHRGAILSVDLPNIHQTFSRYDSPSPVSDPDARFKYFTTAVLPPLLRLPPPPSTTSSTGKTITPGQGILIFIPSYLDFVRLRNFFAASPTTSNIAFGAVSEYTSVSDVRRARSHFVSGRYSFLLYTGRAHHFHRYRLKGVRRVVFYAVPENPVFYTEVVAGFLGQSVAAGGAAEDMSVRAVFSKWDGLRMERIVGTERVRGLIREGKGDTFDFV